ncbi:MAG: 30S ribosomal protein S8 [Candidatus Harrisonbacteria bacterium]|nr:30S ribosomal protein S8 [Candidatus Harrisonbacteria bacterium]
MLHDFLTRIKNAQRARLQNVKAPFSRLDFAIVELLAKHKYIESAEKRGRMPKRIIDVKLRYTDEGGAIREIKTFSKPSRRIYMGYKEFPSAHQGYGILVVSTPLGVMTGGEAKRAKVGGVVLFEIW